MEFDPTACCLRIAFLVPVVVQHMSWSMNSRAFSMCRRSRASAKGCHNCCKTVALNDVEAWSTLGN